MPGLRTRARGELESEVLRILWAHEEPMGAGEIQALVAGRTPAYTTLLTALDRLEKKGHVERCSESARKVRFRAVRSGEEHASSAMLSALSDASDRRAALLSFAGNLEPEDHEVLRRALRSGESG